MIYFLLFNFFFFRTVKLNAVKMLVKLFRDLLTFLQSLECGWITSRQIEAAV